MGCWSEIDKLYEMQNLNILPVWHMGDFSGMNLILAINIFNWPYFFTANVIKLIVEKNISHNANSGGIVWLSLLSLAIGCIPNDTHTFYTFIFEWYEQWI